MTVCFLPAVCVVQWLSSVIGAPNGKMQQSEILLLNDPVNVFQAAVVTFTYKNSIALGWQSATGGTSIPPGPRRKGLDPYTCTFLCTYAHVCSVPIHPVSGWCTCFFREVHDQSAKHSTFILFCEKLWSLRQPFRVSASVYQTVQRIWLHIRCSCVVEH